MSLNLHLLRLFATVARTGSFSRAAKLLNISQPAISKGVRDFELQVGCRLLDRTRNGVRPTLEGAALARHAETLFAAERAAEDGLQAMRNLDSGSLRIGASTTIATYMVPEYLGIFHRAFPGIDLHVVSANTSEIANLMQAQEIEIALVEGPVEELNLISEAWRTDVMSLIASPDHRFAKASGAINLDQLTEEILIVRELGSGTREVVAQALSRHRIEPQRTLEIGSTEAIKQAVAAGVGVAIVSLAAIEDQVRLGKLKAIPIKGVHIERTLWQLKAPGRLDIPAAIAFERIIHKKGSAQSGSLKLSQKERARDSASTRRQARS